MLKNFKKLNFYTFENVKPGLHFECGRIFFKYFFLLRKIDLTGKAYLWGK